MFLDIYYYYTLPSIPVADTGNLILIFVDQKYGRYATMQEFRLYDFVKKSFFVLPIIVFVAAYLKNKDDNLKK